MGGRTKKEREDDVEDDNSLEGKKRRMTGCRQVRGRERLFC